MSFANHEVLPNFGGFFRPLIGRDPYNRKSVEDHLQAALKAVHALEEHFLVNTFLVGERITLADLFVAGLMSRGFQFALDAKWRSENPNTTRWYETVTNQPIYKAIVDKPPMCEEALKNIPPKKEEQPKKQKEPKPQATPKAAAAPKPKAKEADEEEEETKPAEPKAKHPLEALGKPALVLDDWKRQYSNSDTRTVAMPWFWEHYKPEEYSLWRIDYKYNDELTMTFMSANLISGLPQNFSFLPLRPFQYQLDHNYGTFANTLKSRSLHPP
jgi:elongation factor 1-gamma